MVRLQNSPYFCVFKYARAVKQKVWNEAENRERDWGETVFFSRLTRPTGVWGSRAWRPQDSYATRYRFLYWFWGKKRLFCSLPCGLKNKILTLFIQQKITLFLCALSPEKIQATCPISILGNLTLVSGDIAPRHLTTYSVPFINAEKSNRPLSRSLLIKLIATNYHKNWQKFKDG